MKTIVFSVKNFTSKKGNFITLLTVVNKMSPEETYSHQTEVQFENFFLPQGKFPEVERFAGGEIIDITYTRDFKGQAIPVAFNFSGEFDTAINEFVTIY